MLALIVLIAQAGAQAHAYSHLAATGSSQHLAHPAPCAGCNGFAPLLAVAGGASYPAVLAPAGGATLQAIDATAVPTATAPAAYRSRAPPRPL